MSFGPYPDLKALAAAIANDLCEGSDAPVSGNRAIVAQLVERIIQENFRTEEEIQREAERSLAALGASTAGMDRGKLLAGIRERLAKQRGFVL
jgi:hypothetical protein